MHQVPLHEASGEGLMDFQVEMQILASCLLDRGLVDPPLSDKEHNDEAKDVNLDFLLLAEEFPVLAQWLACDPCSFRDSLASQLLDPRHAAQRINIIPHGFPCVPISSVAGAVTGQLAVIQGTVVGIESPQSEIWSR